jgi:enoyl-CoA hydratase/carnithine racemase
VSADELPFLCLEQLAPGVDTPAQALGFVDLRRDDAGAFGCKLPLFPVIGIGPRSHPAAASLDAVIEPPVSAAMIAAQVSANPNAAAVLVQLLRMLPRLSPEDGLIAESLAYAALQGSAEHLAWRSARAHEAPRTEPGKVDLARQGGVLSIKLASPDHGNAIDRAARDALYEALELAALDPEIETVRLGALGKAFCLGAELSEFGTTTDPATAHAIRMRTLPAWQALACADKLEVHIDGACVGAGLEIAAWARRITASRGAWFQLPELAMGIIPGAGGCVSLTRRIGGQRTALLALSGKRLSARTALEWGLIDALVDEPA